MDPCMGRRNRYRIYPTAHPTVHPAPPNRPGTWNVSVEDTTGTHANGCTFSFLDQPMHDTPCGFKYWMEDSCATTDDCPSMMPSNAPISSTDPPCPPLRWQQTDGWDCCDGCRVNSIFANRAGTSHALMGKSTGKWYIEVNLSSDCWAFAIGLQCTSNC
eukprot:gene56976-biopygen4564